MTEFRKIGIIYACGVITGLLLFLLFRSPIRGGERGSVARVIRDTVQILKPAPATVRDSVAPRVVYVRRFQPETVFDTVLIQRRDTAFLSPPFEAVDSNQILASGDTLKRVSFRFPENLFAYDFRPRPDTVVRLSETVVAAEPSHWSCGLSAGYGGTVTQDPVSGNLQARLGPFVGIGLQYRIIQF